MSELEEKNEVMSIAATPMANRQTLHRAVSALVAAASGVNTLIDGLGMEGDLGEYPKKLPSFDDFLTNLVAWRDSLR